MANTSEETSPDDKGRSASPVKIIIITALVAILSIGTGIGATVYFIGGLSSAEDKEVTVEEGEEEEKKVVKEPPQYLSLDPAFVVSFNNKQHARFMQFSVQVMARDESIIELVKQYMPAVRSSLLLLFGGQEYETVITRDGKEQLLVAVRDEINGFLEEEIGKSGIEAAYFTNFIVQ